MPLLCGIAAFLASTAHAAPSTAAPVRPPAEPAHAIAPTDPKSAIQLLLVAGDTLAAIERLQDLAGAGWSDSLLDALVLPDEAPPPKRRAPERSWHPALRFDFGRIPSKSLDDGFWSSSVQASLSRGVAVRGLDQWFAAGLRAHGLQADDETYTGIEPRLGWSLRGRRIDVAADAWALAGPDLDADAGFGSDCRILVAPEIWLGGGFDVSMESTQEAALGAGFDRRSGPWSWSGQLNTGWIRMIAPSRFEPRVMEFDWIRFGIGFEDGSRGVISGWRGSDSISQDVIQDSVARSRDELESFDRDRLRLRARFTLQRTWGGIRLGPSAEFDIRSSLREERWLADSRTNWSDTTPFLRQRGSSTVYAIAGTGDMLTARAAGTLVEAWYVGARISPMLRGDWSTSDRTWQIDALVAWHLVATTDPGHPLEDDQQGLSARASLQRRW